jgi:phosphate starvation-inducible PhoH-like protein
MTQRGSTQRKKTRQDKVNEGGHPTINRKSANWNEAYGYKTIHLTESQKEFSQKIDENTIVWCDAVSGCGKTMTALHNFVRHYLRDTSKKIIIFRTPAEAGTLDKVGFLPDDLASKLAPHFSSTKKLLEMLLNKGKVETDMDHRIFFKVPSYELGNTWDDCLCLIDESQALQPVVMKLLLERIGVGTKVVVAGSSSQMYSDNNKQRNGLKDSIGRFFNSDFTPKYPDMAYHKFTIEDVQRSEIVKSVIRAYEDIA